jgi:hypothetical protein
MKAKIAETETSAAAAAATAAAADAAAAAAATDAEALTGKVIELEAFMKSASQKFRSQVTTLIDDAAAAQQATSVAES